MLGSAFAAKKSTQVVAPKAQVENEYEEGASDENGGTVDEFSDEEIRFSNSFDILKGSAASAPPPSKRLKQNASLRQLVVDCCGCC